jgi:hypothetical protein
MYAVQMRTTLDIDEGVLAAVKEIARRDRRTAGEVASDLIRRALIQPSGGVREPAGRYGFRPFPAAETDARVTNEQVNRLRDDFGI